MKIIGKIKAIPHKSESLCKNCKREWKSCFLNGENTLERVIHQRSKELGRIVSGQPCEFFKRK